MDPTCAKCTLAERPEPLPCSAIHSRHQTKGKTFKLRKYLKDDTNIEIVNGPGACSSIMTLVNVAYEVVAKIAAAVSGPPGGVPDEHSPSPSRQKH